MINIKKKEYPEGNYELLITEYVQLHCPGILHIDSIKPILLRLFLLRWAIWPMGILFDLIYIKDERNLILNMIYDS